MTKERCFTFVKPDYLERAGQIYDFFHDRVSNLIGKSLEDLDSSGIVHIETDGELWRKHYNHVLNSDDRQVREVGRKMVGDFSGKEVAAEILGGPAGLVEICKEVTGETDVSKARENTVRGRFCEDVEPLDYYLSRGIPIPNAFHCSGNKEEAEEEIELWQPYLLDSFFNQ